MEAADLLGLVHPIAVGALQPGVEGFVLKVDAVLATKAQAHLDLAELRGLKARGRDEVVAEVEEVKRRHRLQHVELVHAELEDLPDAAQQPRGGADVAVIDVIRREDALNGVHLEQDLLEPQLDVLETMTPLDFLDFRDHLVPASGFQSAQFRQIEVRLGLRRQDRINFEDKPFDARLQGADRDRVNQTEQVGSLHDQVEAWLERTPFIEMGGFTFRETYRKVVTDMLSRDEETIRTNPLLQDAERELELAGLKRAQVKFDALFDESIHAAQREEGGWRLSWRALQAALFITLYRDEPALQVPFTLLSRMMDIDETLTIWRYRHSLMVQRMIGLKIGTGGSSGHQYLRRTAEQHRVFGDLFALSTFLIPRSALPPLPDAVRAEMGLTYSRKG
ncbi:MAG: hypothetical protein RIT28_5240 [Pseudomonadota bacterium]